jgi:hypothetical protein
VEVKLIFADMRGNYTLYSLNNSNPSSIRDSICSGMTCICHSIFSLPNDRLAQLGPPSRGTNWLLSKNCYGIVPKVCHSCATFRRSHRNPTKTQPFPNRIGGGAGTACRLNLTGCRRSANHTGSIPRQGINTRFCSGIRKSRVQRYNCQLSLIIRCRLRTP